MSFHHGPGTVLGIRDKLVNKTDMVPAFRELTFYWWQKDNKPVNKYKTALISNDEK